MDTLQEDFQTHTPIQPLDLRNSADSLQFSQFLTILVVQQIVHRELGLPYNISSLFLF